MHKNNAEKRGPFPKMHNMVSKIKGKGVCKQQTTQSVISQVGVGRCCNPPPCATYVTPTSIDVKVGIFFTRIPLEMDVLVRPPSVPKIKDQRSNRPRNRGFQKLHSKVLPGNHSQRNDASFPAVFPRAKRTLTKKEKKRRRRRRKTGEKRETKTTGRRCTHRPSIRSPRGSPKSAALAGRKETSVRPTNLRKGLESARSQPSALAFGLQRVWGPTFFFFVGRNYLFVLEGGFLKIGFGSKLNFRTRDSWKIGFDSKLVRVLGMNPVCWGAWV